MTALQHKVAIVTGAGSGIGLTTAVHLGRVGASVAIVGRNTENLKKAKNLILEQGAPAVLELSLDVRNADDMERMADATIREFGCIDILVAAAGTIGSVSKELKIPYALSHLPVEEWDAIIDTNLKGIIYSNRAVLIHMMNQQRGDIINVGSYPASLRGSAHAAAYTASKHAVRGLTLAVAEEMLEYGIRMQTVMPGPTDTPMLFGINAIAKRGVLSTDMVAGHIINMLTMPGDSTVGESVLYAARTGN
jgi:NAD(P)-dependent dehydrogenase (short-subunit alcohol dehydrogenase family)